MTRRSFAMAVAVVATSVGVRNAALVAQGRPSVSDSQLAEVVTAEWMAAYDTRDGARLAELPGFTVRYAGLVSQDVAVSVDTLLNTLLLQTTSPLRGSPWMWFALAQSLQRPGQRCAPARKVRLELWLSHCRRVFAALDEALRLDSTFVPALLELDAVHPLPELWAHPQVEYRFIQLALGRPEVPPLARRQLGRRQVLLSVLMQLPTAWQDLGVAEQESLLTGGEQLYFTAWMHAREESAQEAVNAYLHAASADGDGEHLDWIDRDVALIGTPSEQAEWRALAATSRYVWLDRFWSDRDLANGMRSGMRLVEHIRRWDDASVNFRMYEPDHRRRQPTSRRIVDAHCSQAVQPRDQFALEGWLTCRVDALVQTASGLDDRGLVVMRHGRPQRVAEYPGIEGLAVASWLYTTAGRPLVIHFGRIAGADGFAAYGMPRGDLMSACRIVPAFCVVAARRELGDIPPERMTQLVERGMVDLRRLLTTDAAPIRFNLPLGFNAAAYGLGTVTGRFLIAVDIPLSAFKDLVGSDGLVAVRWRINVREQGGDWVRSVDTVQRITALPPGSNDESYATYVLEYAAGAGTLDVRVIVSDSAGTIGAMFSRDGMVVLGRGTTAGLSDVVLMPDPGQGASRTIEGVPVRLSPTFTAGASRSIAIGYVLQGFAGESVRVTVEIRKVADSDGRAALSLAFDEQPTSDREFLVRRIGIERLGNGGYDVTVSVPLPDGTTATRTQRMLVRR